MWEVNRLNPELETFLGTKKSGSTIRAYRVAFNHFLNYYHTKYGSDKPFKHYLNRIFDDLEKPLRERRKIAEMELNGYIKFLQEQRKSSNTILTYIAAIRNYLRFKDVPLRMRFVATPRPVIKEENRKHRWTVDEIRRFVEAAGNYRDKAIIVCLFQSGLAVNELSNLDYRHVQEQLENNKIPIMLRLVREKTSISFVTFFGYDSVKYLKLYLQTRKNLSPDSPLFTKWGTNKRITIGAIESKFRELAETLGFINNHYKNGKGNGGAYNPARPHSLRSAFNSRLMGKTDGTLREFWMGHSIGKVARAYLAMPDEEMRELYMDAEKYLAIEKTSRNMLIEEKTADIETKQEIVELKSVLAGISKQYNRSEAENIDLKKRMSQIDLDNTDLRKKQQHVLDELAEIRIIIKKMLNGEKGSKTT